MDMEFLIFINLHVQVVENIIMVKQN